MPVRRRKPSLRPRFNRMREWDSTQPDPAIDTAVQNARSRLQTELGLHSNRRWHGAIRTANKMIVSPDPEIRKRGKNILGDYIFVRAYSEVKKYFTKNDLPHSTFDEVFSEVLGSMTPILAHPTKYLNIPSQLNDYFHSTITDLESDAHQKVLIQNSSRRILSPAEKESYTIRIERLLHLIPEKNAEIVRRRFGIGVPAQSVKAIAAELNMSSGQVRDYLKHFFHNARDFENMEKMANKKVQNTQLRKKFLLPPKKVRVVARKK